MDELLFYAKIVLLIVLIYDVVILFRKPEEGSKVVVLNFWKELERKGINGVLIPCTMIFIISLDYAQGLNLTLSFVLFILSMIYIAYPRPFALGKNVSLNLLSLFVIESVILNCISPFVSLFSCNVSS